MDIYNKILVFWNPWWFKEEVFEFGERQMSKNFDEIIRSPLYTIFNGVRRSGKSTIMQMIVKKLLDKGINRENICFINFDDDNLIPYRNNPGFLDDLVDTYVAFKNPEGVFYLFFDEIQMVENWQSWAKKMYDRHGGKDIKIFFSGSSAQLLQQKEIKRLSGRYISQKVFPLTFKEYLNFSNIVFRDKSNFLKNQKKIERAYDNYKKFGGFPAVFLNESEKVKIELLKEYYETILLKDVFFEKHSINFSILQDLCYFLISNIASEHSLRSIGKAISVSAPTVKEYLHIILNSYLFFMLPRFSYSVKKQLANSKKIYAIDTGLINAISFKFSENQGKILENLVFLDLIKKNKEIFYYKNEDGYEIDFLVKEDLKVTRLIQVCYDYNEDNSKRELRSLVNGLKTFKLKEGLIITSRNKKQELLIDDKKILIQPYYDWILNS